MKRICIFCQTWESGGIEAFLSNSLSHMDLSDFEVDVVAEVLQRSIFTDDLKALGITFYELSGSQRKLAKNYHRFSKLIDRRRYDVLHLNIFQAVPMIYLLLAKRKGIPIRIVHSHNTMLRQSRMRAIKMGIHKLVGHLFLGEATDLWACSDAAARFMFPSKPLERKGYRFIPNGIDLRRFAFNVAERERTRKQLNLEGTFVIGNVGRLCHQKNQTFLIDVFSKIYAEDSSARLLLVGEGEAFAELKEKTERCSLSDAVILFGTTARVEKLLWAMDVFVFPSVFEGLGIAAVEAQAANLPTICSDRVPQEALVTSLVRRMPLNAPISQWSDAIVNAGERKFNVEATKQLKARGFDVNAVSAMMSAAYCR